MDCHPSVNEAVRLALQNPRVNGYGPVLGLPEAREAIAKRYNTKYGMGYSVDDIIITSGCSHALQMVISGCVSEGMGLLLPKPGFSIYHTIADHFGLKSIDYPLLPNQQWQVDLVKLEELIVEHRPAAWLINNPSNPCGSVYSKQHLLDCLSLARKYRLIVIADEIYEDIVFSQHAFIPMASLAKNQTVLSCSGLAKRFMVPGWRVGWVCVHDPKNSAQSLRTAFFNLAGLILGPCTLIQAAIPYIFEHVPESFNLSINRLLENNAAVFVDAFANASCDVSVVAPQGTLYMMLRLPEGTDDVLWCQQLLAEENVLLLPGSVQSFTHA